MKARSLPRTMAGFTLVELLASMAILAMLLLILLSITGATQRTWTYTTARIEQFREAREAFESMTRRISQATLNTYWDYDNPAKPARYLRQSELRFISGPNLVGNATSSPPRPLHAIFFQAPLGFVNPDQDPGAPAGLNLLPNLLNTWGFYIEFADDSQYRPSFIQSTARYRFRLMEMMEPSESLTVYQYTSGLTASGSAANLSYTARTWFTVPLGSAAVPRRAIAENVVALVLLPKLSKSDEKAYGYTDASLAPAYSYDSTAGESDPNLNSKNQLPPVVQLTMVVVDEASYQRFQGSSTAMPDLGFIKLPLFVDATKYSGDLQLFESNLQSKSLTYHVFSTNISIKAAKWSRAQAN